MLGKAPLVLGVTKGLDAGQGAGANGAMTDAPHPAPQNDKWMRAYLVFIAIALVPVALSYGIDPANVLPRFLNISVTGADQTQIFRALMCLYLACSLFWGIAAFRPAWQRVAVIWGIFFMFSLASGRVISLFVDGPASRLLDFYLVVEILGGLTGLAVLAYTRKTAV